MNIATSTRPWPRGRVAWMGAVVLALIGGAALRPHALLPGGDDTSPRPQPAAIADAAPKMQRLLQFRDRADGGIDIVDAASGSAIDQAHGEQGFLRGTLRAMARERRLRGVGAAAPLQLTLDAQARLALVDPTTGTRIELDAFGPTNAAVFARWLGISGDRP